MTTDSLRNIPILGKLWEQIEAMPPPVTEDSLLLRILVQLLVIVGIVATDVASEEALTCGLCLLVLWEQLGVGTAGAIAM